LLDKPAGLPVVPRCGDPQDLIDRTVAVDRGEDSLPRRIEGEIEVGVSPVDIERALSPHHRRPGSTRIGTSDSGD